MKTTTRRVVHGPGGTTTVTEYTSYSSSGGGGGGGGNFRDFGNFGDRTNFGDGGGGGDYSPAGYGGRTDNRGDDGGQRSKSGSGTRRGGSEPRRQTEPPMKLEGKTYDEIKAQCQRENRLFEDPDFPAVDESVFPSKPPPRPFEWKRPGELASDPQLYVGGASRLDIQQGQLGDCWLLAAISSLCQYPDLLQRVIPPGQGFSAEEGYCGMFRFNFWVFGKWKEVIIDDLLPTYNGRLVFMHSPEKNEFWSALMEKAYAKLYGTYENLKGGSSSEAMEDFTGGLTEIFDLLQNAPTDLFTIMSKAVDLESMMGCSVDQGGMAMEGKLANGLIVGHAYSVTDAKAVDVETSRGKGTVWLVRARNPWGDENEWNGAWSDKSREWSLIPAPEREKLGLVMSNDGEFWMSYQDFVKNFSKLEICNLGPDSATDVSKKRFKETVHEGSWKRRVNAGGCPNNRNTFWTNPQYRVTVVDADEGDADNTGTLIVALLQKERRSAGGKQGSELLTIGYSIYQLKDPNCGLLDQEFFRRNKRVAKSPQFIDMREVTGRHKLAPGTYCIVPSTFDAGEEGDFLLRVYTEKPISSSEIDEETKIQEPSELQRSIQQRQPADAQSEKNFAEMFKKVAGDDMEVDAYELQHILNTVYMKEFTFEGFSIDTCKSLIAMKDFDRSGKLNYDECKVLWNSISFWEEEFKEHDNDKSGNFNSYELRAALKHVGMSVSNSTFNSLIQRFSHRDGKLYFDDYVHCISRLYSIFDIFKQASGGTSKAQFSLDEFVSSTVYS